jgi:hypothetical protein
VKSLAVEAPGSLFFRQFDFFRHHRCTPSRTGVGDAAAGGFKVFKEDSDALLPLGNLWPISPLQGLFVKHYVVSDHFLN